VQRGAAPPAQLLSGSQERALWEEVLQQLAAEGEDAALLVAHAAGLAAAAVRATQSLLVPSRSAMSAEEQLLVRALAALRERCRSRGLVSLRLAPPEALQFLAALPAPAITGQARLSPLQQRLQEQCWPDIPLLLPEPAAAASVPRLLRYPALADELAGCAAWCRARLEVDGSARLLVLSACGEPSLATQGELLWRELAGNARHDDALRERLLAVEGGEALRHQGLIDDALAALALGAPQVDTEALFALLRSPYFDFGTPAELWELQGWFEKRGLARWTATALREGLQRAASRAVAATRLGAWFGQLAMLLDERARRPAAEWAQRFSDALAAAGFCRGAPLDSREQQRFVRWGELLDELASLDAVLGPLSAAAALGRLQRLATAARHQAASGDAAITLCGELADPLVDYDGIWVLGLTESRWPAAPRPDAYVALAEQHRCHWPESGVSERRAQALWALSRWRQRTRELVLSHAEMEGDLHHRPSALLGAMVEAGASWEAGAAAGVDTTVLGQALPASDLALPPIPDQALGQPLSGGASRLQAQQECAFRAQAQWRLAARPPDPVSDGITPTLRGSLLHGLLQGLWGELGDQGGLLALDAAAEHALLERHWQEALRKLGDAGAQWLDAAVLERERARTLRLVGRLLEMERQRAPFTVQDRERQLEWAAQGARLKLRIDRIDRAPGGERILLDYKSGAKGPMHLHEGAAEPLQLALYVAALAQRDEPVAAAALLAMKPGELRYAGVAAAADLLPGMKTVEEWGATSAQWRDELLQLLALHLSGGAQLAGSIASCRYCHLPALCRRAAVDDLEQDDE
jgi:probable DNA repair protein